MRSFESSIPEDQKKMFPLQPSPEALNSHVQAGNSVRRREMLIKYDENAKIRLKGFYFHQAIVGLSSELSLWLELNTFSCNLIFYAPINQFNSYKLRQKLLYTKFLWLYQFGDLKSGFDAGEAFSGWFWWHCD